FELDRDSPYMLLVADVKKEKRLDENKEYSGLDKLKAARSLVPAVTHVDYSSRVQTVRREDNPLYYDMIMSFYRETGCPMVINTSFNVRGEPLVLSPEDAYRCFRNTQMDYLMLGNFLLDKKEQPFPAAAPHAAEKRSGCSGGREWIN
ncbi:MAG: carbamoyltransferase C-terminal domain-containing protein, partial [Candidatus Omnitrophica bacterium]|nr:carbamoyltransferase C-terminal domain-containing protein [Candidatus Omnitrophota bacterium]